MARIVFIGAGSLGFTRNLVRDILSFDRLKDSTIVLMDINREKLKWAKQAVDILVEHAKSPAKVIATLNRREALKGADAVLCTILAGGTDVWRYDVEIPKQYGVDFCVGDTRGPAGIFRALRTIPVMLDICKDIEKFCPNAIYLNYTNPMAMLCMAMQKSTKLQTTGLCHSVQGTAEMLAGWIGAKMDDITYKCAGLNHQAWYLQYNWRGKNAYPLIFEAVKKKKIYNEEIVRNEMFLHLGYYATESSGHNSEYNWWFRKRPDLIKKYCLAGTGWNPGEYGFILKEYLKTEKNWKQTVKEWLKNADFPLNRGKEYAAYIINSYMGGEPYEFNGNVLNTGLIPNLPQDCCVEVPVFVDRKGLHPVYVGALPPQLAALNSITAQVESMAVNAAINGDPETVFHAIAYDPLTASVLSLSEIRKMVRQMLKQNRKYLTTFKNVSI